MADALRNEVQITLDGTERVMRATFSAIRAIERDLQTNLIPLLTKIGNGDVGVSQAAVVIKHGLEAHGDTRFTIDQIGDWIMEAGLSEVMMPVIEFLGHAMNGVSLGKSEKAKAS